MNKIKATMDGYHDGIYSEQEALSRLVHLEVSPFPKAFGAIMSDWLNLKVKGKATLRRVDAWLKTDGGK